ncbi:1980_t:CDS:10 [Entrophospora sp. SA101]|nr:1980_t:CDS:10 [Entrophospora sp. SA101]
MHSHQLYVLKDYPKAIEVLQEVIKIDPNIHSAWFTLGTIQDEIGCLEKALQLYLVAAHLTPHDGALWKRLVLFEDALTTYEAILLNSETNNPTAWMRVGLCHRELGNFENAAEYFTAVVEDSPDNLDAKYGQLGELEAEIHKKMTEFQGITFEKWFEFFIQFIITATKNGHESEAYDVVMLVSKANIFYHNERHKTTFKEIYEYALLLAWGLYTSNYIVVCESARWLSANSQKYFLRQIKAMDSGISDSSPTKPDAGLLTLYGHILGCSRSYNGALGYYARAALVKPKDPLVCFSMGLAYLHRAMQRKTSNRHLQILQGFNFLYEYYELKGKNQEAEYNLGHAFHQLGLTHLAIPHYEKALKLPSVNQILKQKIDKKKQLETDENEEVENFEENDPTDIRKEAAYNLYLIYMETGSPALAQMLLKKYCAI